MTKHYQKDCVPYFPYGKEGERGKDYFLNISLMYHTVGDS